MQKNKIKLNKIDLSILILLIIFLIRNFSQFDLNNFVSIIRFLLLIIFSLSIYLDKEKQKIVLNALFLTILWQSFLAYYQFIYQKSLAPYYFFGETNLQHFASISRAQFFREEKILSYGSTAHPNILAGIISIFSILFIDKKQKKKLLEILLLVNAFLICYVAQSLSAFLILVLYLIYLIIKKISKNKNTINWQKIFNLSLIIFFVFTPLIIKQINLASAKNHLSISRRVMLNTAAWQMFLDKPLFGVGLNNFVNELETYSQNPETVRFVQPVHHLGLLILSEGGLLLGLILLILVKKFYQYIDWSKLLILSPIASLDHHLITQALGLITLMLFIIFTRRRSWS